MLAQGAEAVLTEENGLVVKTRVKKGYRHPALDEELRFKRTKREASVLKKLYEKGVAVPKVLSVSDDSIVLEKINGRTTTLLLDDEKSAIKTAEEIGVLIGEIHSVGIIHGDLTPSNFIRGEKTYAIDFGLSFHSLKAEDKATDLHVLEEALEARHPSRWKEYWTAVLDAYEKTIGEKEYLQVMARMKAIEKRGRYKAKNG